MKKVIKNLPASINKRLRLHAEETGRSFTDIFYNYAIQQFLYRLSQCKYRETFMVKGGLAFWGWGINLRRTTRDIDFQAFVENEVNEILRIVKEICSIPVKEDGIVFDTESAQGDRIMVGAEQEGVRVRFKAYLGKAYVWLQVDVAFANVITPKEVILEYQTILDTPTFKLLGYNRATAIAEKFQAMVILGSFNSRYKDFYDIYLLANECNFEGIELARAISATFSNRNTGIPLDIPIALSDDFGIQRNFEWISFLRRINYEGNDINDFLGVIDCLRRFLLPPMQAVAKGENFDMKWTASGNWSL